MSAGTPDSDRSRRTERALERWRAGDRAGLDEICAQYHAGLQIFLRLRHRRLSPALQRQIEVEDLIQETWRRACASLATFEYRGPDSFRRWIWELALNEFRDQRTYWKAKRRDPQRLEENQSPSRATATETGDVARVPAPDRSPSSNVRRSEDLEKTVAILAQLTHRERRIVLMREFYDASWSEIAAAVKAVTADSVRKEYSFKVLPKIERLREVASEPRR